MLAMKGASAEEELAARKTNSRLSAPRNGMCINSVSMNWPSRRQSRVLWPDVLRGEPSTGDAGGDRFVSRALGWPEKSTGEPRPSQGIGWPPPEPAATHQVPQDSAPAPSTTPEAAPSTASESATPAAVELDDARAGNPHTGRAHPGRAGNAHTDGFGDHFPADNAQPNSAGRCGASPASDHYIDPVDDGHSRPTGNLHADHPGRADQRRRRPAGNLHPAQPTTVSPSIHTPVAPTTSAPAESATRTSAEPATATPAQPEAPHRPHRRHRPHRPHRQTPLSIDRQPLSSPRRPRRLSPRPTNRRTTTSAQPATSTPTQLASAAPDRPTDTATDAPAVAPHAHGLTAAPVFPSPTQQPQSAAPSSGPDGHDSVAFEASSMGPSALRAAASIGLDDAPTNAPSEPVHVKQKSPQPRQRTSRKDLRKSSRNHPALWMTTPWKRLLTREFVHRRLWMNLGANPLRPRPTSSSGQVPHLSEWAP